ncbi:hypothetical protein EHO61_02605 [Leptospira fluminis]|uniref:Phosphotyrosine protein phosphatase I domain-containing protein n=1 Tax=Leptospira fluminis TaxID=2484979 RepID=A0A4V3JES0_9LEPT|nr:hypothetical protein [Leptospira fluminis]TGK20779.1 hypothetical protein EHO61_02605 [Leptospira fluminis]
MSPLFPTLRTFFDKRKEEFDSISSERKDALNSLAEGVLDSFDKRSRSNLLFVCTQNSRRSQFSQVFGASIPQYLGIPGIKSFSGGTEISAVHPSVLETLEKIGFRLDNEGPPKNPKYSVRWADGTSSMSVFSKKYSDPPNPHGELIAIMVCSTADAACPYISGAEVRISLPYEDPKSSDGTEGSSAKYLKTAEDISRELLFAFQSVKNGI